GGIRRGAEADRRAQRRRLARLDRIGPDEELCVPAVAVAVVADADVEAAVRPEAEAPAVPLPRLRRRLEALAHGAEIVAEPGGVLAIHAHVLVHRLVGRREVDVHELRSRE